MQFRRQPKRELGLDITPLIDVVFLLLIFFMVTTTFTDKTQLTIDLPEAHGEIQMVQPLSLEVLINASGEYHVNGQRLINDNFATLKSAISQQLAENSEPVFIISADGNAPHKSVVMAMDIAGQLGIQHLSVTTVQSSE